MSTAYCFVLMPFGQKTAESGQVIDFNRIYEQVIRPGVKEAEMEPIRADEEMVGGVIHKPLFERIMICDYAVADLTTANPNVLYELGVRHGIRPYSTVLIAASGTRLPFELPFDVQALRTLRYEIDGAGQPANPEKATAELANRLESCRDPVEDSPLYQLVTDLPRPEIDRLKTDVFRDAVEYSQQIKDRLRDARREGTGAVTAVQNEIKIRDADPAILIDLLLSYRATEAWEEMVDLANEMPAPVRGTVLVREQLGLALNRLGRHEKAENILRELIDEHGPSSETNGILGRVYKDQWEKAHDRGDAAAPALLDRAIETYVKGFEADWRDAYPGINAVTLMESKEPPDERQEELLPVVRYAVERRLEGAAPDYWDYATLLELEVLSLRHEKARSSLSHVLATLEEPWQAKTTARNLDVIGKKRANRGEDVSWIQEASGELKEAGDRIAPQ